jgi:hypothetical protein
MSRYSYNFAGSLLVIKSLLSMDSTPACVIELVASELQAFLDSPDAAHPQHSADVGILKARIGARSSLRMDSETLVRSFYGTGNLLENWQAAMRLQSSSDLSKLCAQQEPLLASALLAVAPAKRTPPLTSALYSQGLQVETVALAVLRTGCQVPGDALLKRNVEAWCKAYVVEW